MAVGEKVKSLLDGMGTNQPGSALTLDSIDIEKTKARLRLKQEATERGKKNLPRADAPGFDDVEQKIISSINDEVRIAREACHDHLQSYQHRIQNLEGIGLVSKMEQIAIAAEGNFKAHVLARKAALFTAREDVSHIKSGFENFKQRYNLEGSATYPKSTFLYVSIVILLVVLETYFNGTFLAQGHEDGLFGSIPLAFGFSALNAVLSFCLGNYAIRLSLHPEKSKKYPAFLLCLVLPIMMLIFNLALAHLRMAMIALPVEGKSSDAMKAAMTSLINTPFALNDLQSGLLFAMGCVCCLIMTLDFWKMDDPFPGFGAISRDYKAKIDQYADMKSTVLEELQELSEESNEQLNETASLVTAMSSQAGTIYASQDRWQLVFADHMRHLEEAGQQMLGFYRTANMSARPANAEVPPHFNQIWTLEKIPAPEPDASLKATIEGIKSEASTMQEAYRDCARRIGKAYNNALDDYKTIDEL